MELRNLLALPKVWIGFAALAQDIRVGYSVSGQRNSFAHTEPRKCVRTKCEWLRFC